MSKFNQMAQVLASTTASTAVTASRKGRAQKRALAAKAAETLAATEAAFKAGACLAPVMMLRDTRSVNQKEAKAVTAALAQKVRESRQKEPVKDTWTGGMRHQVEAEKAAIGKAVLEGRLDPWEAWGLLQAME